MYFNYDSQANSTGLRALGMTFALILPANVLRNFIARQPVTALR
jgi:hypothetical protein